MISIFQSWQLAICHSIGNMKVSPYNWILAVCLFAASPYALGLNSDHNLPIDVLADSATIDERKGISEYQGKVSIKQGTLLIQADHVQIITENGEAIQIIASSAKGSDLLAHYEQQPDNEEQLVIGDAQQITYQIVEKHLLFKGNASLKQTDKTSLSAELLSYDIAKGIVNLDGQDDKQVIMTITPGNPSQ